MVHIRDSKKQQNLVTVVSDQATTYTYNKLQFTVSFWVTPGCNWSQ